MTGDRTAAAGADDGNSRPSLLLEARNLSVTFGAVEALRDVSLGLRRGTVYGLVGPNGAGKSTLVKVLSGLLRPDSGTLKMNGNDVPFGEQHLMNGLGLRFVPQETSLIDELTVDENINLGDELRSGPFLRRRRMSARSSTILGQLGIRLPLSEKVASLPTSERRLVMVAKAMRNDLKLLILDEPTAAMSKDEAAAVLRVVQQLKHSDVTTVLITHRFDEVLKVCDEVIAVRDGALVQEWESEKPSLADLVDVVTGHCEWNLTDRTASSRKDTVALRVRGISGDELSPTDVDFGHGEVVGVVGRPGSGAEQFMDIVGGIRPCAAARIEIDGHVVAAGSPARALAAGIGYLPADRESGGLGQLTIRENLTLSSLPAIAGRGWMIRPKKEQQVALAHVSPHLRARLGESFQNLSGGNRQLVLVARLVTAGARVLVLNNPTVGVDVVGREALRRQISKLAGEDCTVIVYSSEPTELVGLADRVLTFEDGSLQRTIEGADITERAVLAASMVATDA